MQRFAAVTFWALTGALSPALRAQTPAAPATQKAFSYCSVIDTAGHRVWASPVFEYEYRATGNHQFTRVQDMATDFHAYVGSLGGAGDKNCQMALGGTAELEAMRDEARAILTKRFLGIRTHKWMDVNWAPKPWDPASVAAAPAAVDKYFYCVATDADLRKTVAATVFAMSVDSAVPAAEYTQANAYGEQFTREVAAAHGLAQAYPSCHVKDTQAEADKAFRDYRKLFSGFTMKFIEVSWKPTAGTVSTPATPATPMPAAATEAPATEPAPKGRLGVRIDTVTPSLATGLGLDRPRGALVLEVLAGSLAEAAGVRPMDVVLGLNRQPVEQASDLPTLSSSVAAGAPVTLQLWRERKEIELALSPSPATTPGQASGPAPASTTNAPTSATAATARYCHLFLQFVGKPGGVRSKVWENLDSDGSETAMTASLVAFTTRMHQQQPKVWHDFASKRPVCDMNLGYCYANVLRHFGTSQIAGQFCKKTREEAEADWANLWENSQGMETIAWPAGS